MDLKAATDRAQTLLATERLGCDSDADSDRKAIRTVLDHVAGLERRHTELVANGDRVNQELANERTWREGATSARDTATGELRKLRAELEAARRVNPPSIPCAEVLQALTGNVGTLNGSELANRARVALNDFGSIRTRATRAIELLEFARGRLGVDAEEVPEAVDRLHADAARANEILCGLEGLELVAKEVESTDDWNRREDLVPTVDRLLAELASRRATPPPAASSSPLAALAGLLKDFTSGSVEVTVDRATIKITATD